MRVLFVTGLPHQLVSESTSLCLLIECQRRGHEIFQCELRHVFATEQNVSTTAQKLDVSDEKLKPLSTAKMPLSEFDAVFIRPSDYSGPDYIHALRLLCLARQQTLFINDPLALLTNTSKLYVTRLEKGQAPTTLVTSNADSIREFLSRQSSGVVIKPVDSGYGRGVFLLRAGDWNINALIDVATDLGRQLVVVQSFVPNVLTSGDKRVVMLGGKPIGAVVRRAKEDEFRTNIACGGQDEKASLSERELAVCMAVGERLLADGLYLAGIDLVDAQVIEVNIVAIEGLPTIGLKLGRKLETEIIDWIEQRK